MNIQHNNFPFYHIIIDEVFPELILPSIYDEINLLENESKPPEFTSSAKEFGGKILKKNKGLFLSQSKFFNDLKIVNYIDNVIKKVNFDENWKNKALQRMYNSLVWGGELLNYYSSEDYYLPHTDAGIFSMVIFLYKNYSECKGGNLYFPEYNYTHNCKNNQSIIFLSKEIHGVTKLEGNKNINRYSIVTFSKYNEEIDMGKSPSISINTNKNILYT